MSSEDPKTWLRFDDRPGVLSKLADSTAPTLAEFLLARITEDEAQGGHHRDVPRGETECLCGDRGYIAEHNFGERGAELKITHDVGYNPPTFQNGYILSEGGPRTHTHVLVGDEVREVIDKWPLSASSERVIAECEAKRRIVQQALGIAEVARVTGTDDPGGERILQLLALPFADHPDYDEAWKP